MRPSAWQFIFFLTLVYACCYANAGAIAKRASDDDDSESGGLSGMVNGAISMIRNYVPFMGDLIARALEWCVRAISLFEIGTNGAIARFLGGSLPCTVALSGVECTGLTNNGGFGKVVMDVLHDLPPYLFPGILETVMDLGIKMFMNPTMDILTGGVVVDDP